MLRNGWHISFLEEDLKTPLPLKLTFAIPDKLLEIHERWGEGRLVEDKSALEYAINWAGVPIWLILSPEQLCEAQTQRGVPQPANNQTGYPMRHGSHPN
jgi:hypothetical protein